MKIYTLLKSSNEGLSKIITYPESPDSDMELFWSDGEKTITPNEQIRQYVQASVIIDLLGKDLAAAIADDYQHLFTEHSLEFSSPNPTSSATDELFSHLNEELKTYAKSRLEEIDEQIVQFPHGLKFKVDRADLLCNSGEYQRAKLEYNALSSLHTGTGNSYLELRIKNGLSKCELALKQSTTIFQTPFTVQVVQEKKQNYTIDQQPKKLTENPSLQYSDTHDLRERLNLEQLEKKLENKLPQSHSNFFVLSTEFKIFMLNDNEVISYINEKKLNMEIFDLLEKAFFENVFPPIAQPKLVVVGGASGAGKTTYRRSIEWKNFHLHDMDEVLIIIPEYQTDHQQLGAVKAFQNWWSVAQALANRMFEYAVSKRYNIMYDRTCGTSTSFLAINNAKEAGYLIELHGIYVSEKVAQTRVAMRQETEGRAVTSDIVTECGKRFSALWPYYVEIADTAQLHDGNDTNNLLYENNRILDSKAYEDFCALGNHHPVITEIFPQTVKTIA